MRQISDAYLVLPQFRAELLNLGWLLVDAGDLPSAGPLFFGAAASCFFSPQT